MDIQTIRTKNHLAHTVYDMKFYNGKLISIRYWDYPTNRDIAIAKKHSDNKLYGRCWELFENAIATFCHDKNISKEEFEELFSAMFADEECLERAKKIIIRELEDMTRQVNLITSVCCKQYFN